MEGDEGGESVGKVFVILGEWRFRPNHENVHSTTQRRGRTTKPLDVVGALYDFHAQCGNRGKRLLHSMGVEAAVGTAQPATEAARPLSHPLSFSRAKMQLEVGILMRRVLV